MFGLTDSSPVCLGGHSTCEILACCAGDAIPIGGSWAASALRLNGRWRWHGLRLCSVPTSRSLAFSLPSAWLGREFEVQGKGRLWWRKPCWMTALQLCSWERKKGPCHQYSDTCVQITPMMDGALPVLQDTASAAFEEGVRFPS